MEDTRDECYQKLINRLDTKVNLKFQLISCSDTLSLGYKTNQLML